MLTYFKTYNLIPSQDAMLGLEDECYKKLSENMSFSSIVFSTWSSGLILSTLKKVKDDIQLSSHETAAWPVYEANLDI